MVAFSASTVRRARDEAGFCIYVGVETRMLEKVAFSLFDYCMYVHHPHSPFPTPGEKARKDYANVNFEERRRRPFARKGVKKLVSLAAAGGELGMGKGGQEISRFHHLLLLFSPRRESDIPR